MFQLNRNQIDLLMTAADGRGTPNYFEFDYGDGEIQSFFFDYKEISSGLYGFICSDEPIRPNWWV